jgi:ribonuclease P protein component
MDYSFNKQQRLCSKKLIDQVFDQGQAVVKYPLKMVFLETQFSEVFPIKVGFSVPKKFQRKAVDRNLIKRRMREAYRLNKHLAVTDLNKSQKQYAVFIIYLSKEKTDFKSIQDKTIFLLRRLVEIVNSKQSAS